MENTIGVMYGTLAEKGIDTTMLSLEEVIDRYYEIINEEGEEVSKEEIVEDVAEEVAEMEETAEEVTEETPVEEEKTEPENTEIDDDTYAELVVEHREEIEKYLKDNNLV